MSEGIQAVLDATQKVGDEVRTVQTSLETLEAAHNEYKQATDAKLEALQSRAGGRIVAPGMPGAEAADYERSYSLHDILKRASGIGLDADSNGRGGLSQVRYPADVRERIMQGDTNPNGGYLVPDLTSNEIIEELTAMTVLDKLGVRNFEVDPGFGQVQFPKLTGGPTVQWIGEAAAPAASDSGTGLITAQSKKVAALVEVSNDLLRMSNASVETILREQFMRDVALAVDIAGLRGTGGAFQPRGIVNTPGISSENAGDPNGGAITYDLLVDTEANVEAANSRMLSPGWCMHPRLWAQIRKLTAGSIPMFPNPNVGVGLQGELLRNMFGHTVELTTQIPTNLVEGSSTNLTELYFGDWADLVMVRWGGMEIRASRDAHNPVTGNSAYTQDLTFFIVIMRLDFIVRHAESFSVITDVASS